MSVKNVVCTPRSGPIAVNGSSDSQVRLSLPKLVYYTYNISNKFIGFIQYALARILIKVSREKVKAEQQPTSTKSNEPSA